MANAYLTFEEIATLSSKVDMLFYISTMRVLLAPHTHQYLVLLDFWQLYELLHVKKQVGQNLGDSSDTEVSSQ